MLFSNLEITMIAAMGEFLIGSIVAFMLAEKTDIIPMYLSTTN